MLSKKKTPLSGIQYIWLIVRSFTISPHSVILTDSKTNIIAHMHIYSRAIPERSVHVRSAKIGAENPAIENHAVCRTQKQSPLYITAYLHDDITFLYS